MSYRQNYLSAYSSANNATSHIKSARNGKLLNKYNNDLRELQNTTDAKEAIFGDFTKSGGAVLGGYAGVKSVLKSVKEFKKKLKKIKDEREAKEQDEAGDDEPDIGESGIQEGVDEATSRGGTAIEEGTSRLAAAGDEIQTGVSESLAEGTQAVQETAEGARGLMSSAQNIGAEGSTISENIDGVGGLAQDALRFGGKTITNGRTFVENMVGKVRSGGQRVLGNLKGRLQNVAQRGNKYKSLNDEEGGADDQPINSGGNNYYDADDASKGADPEAEIEMEPMGADAPETKLPDTGDIEMEPMGADAPAEQPSIMEGLAESGKGITQATGETAEAAAEGTAEIAAEGAAELGAEVAAEASINALDWIPIVGEVVAGVSAAAMIGTSIYEAVSVEQKEKKQQEALAANYATDKGKAVNVAGKYAIPVLSSRQRFE